MILRLLAVLGIGVLLGLRITHPDLGKLAGILQKAGIFLLVFCMGLSLGTRRDIVDNLPVIGVQAAVMAASVVLGSIVCAWAFDRLAARWRKRRGL